MPLGMRKTAAGVSRNLRNYIRNQLILELGDLVLEPQLALLEPGELELVRSGRAAKRFDRRVEIAMLHSQAHQPRCRRNLAALDLPHCAHPLLNRFRLRYSPFVNGSSCIITRPVERRETKPVCYV